VRRPYLLVFLLALLVAAPGFGQVPYVDPVLHTVLRSEIRTVLEQPPAALGDAPQGRSLGGLIALDWSGPAGQPRVGLLIQLRDLGALDQLRAAGAEIGSVIGDIVTAQVPLSAVPSVIGMSQLSRVEVARNVDIVHDTSMVVINAHSVRTWNGTQWVGFAGQDVIVGIYDSGLDYTHPDFRDANNQTRVLGLWDQTLGGAPPAGFGYGYYCDPASLNSGACPQRDTNGHGTHVAGSAAGDGTAGAAGNPQYAGVAPRADLIIVKGGNTGFSENRIIDGVNWIFQEATRLGKPAVVNLSLGGHFGPHDGTRLYEIAIDRLSGPGRVVTVAAGNEGSNPVTAVIPRDYIHAMARPAVGQTEVFTIEVPRFQGTPGRCDNFALIDIWYEGTDRLDLTVVRPNGTSVTAPFGTLQRVSAPTGGIEIDNAAPAEDRPEGLNPANNDHEAYIYINDCSESGLPDPGIWTIRVTPTRVVSNERYHMWIGASIFGGQPAIGRRGFDNSHSVGMPGTANRAVTVGAFTTRLCWPTSTGTRCFAIQQPIGSIAFFSSVGPTRDGRLKPEITAPGFGIVSALSSSSNPNPAFVVADGVHRMNAGTSMSAPHVAGAVALMFQQNRTLTPEDVKRVLAGSARQDEFTNNTYSGLPGDQGIPNFTWGYGKLDVLNALALVGDFVTVRVAVQGVAPTTPPLSEAGGLIPLLRLSLDTEGDRTAELNALAFDVIGNDRDTARVVVVRDVNGNGAIEPGEPRVGQSPTFSLPPGDTVRVKVPVEVRVEPGGTVPLLVALKTSGAVPNAAIFTARFDPQGSRGTGTLIQTGDQAATQFQASVRTSVLAPDEIFALSENPVRSDEVIFSFSTAPTMLSVYTISGRRVVDLLPKVRTGGRRIVWNLTNQEGNPVAAGVYLVVYTVGDRTERQKLIVTRPGSGSDGRE
jgi:minor extracellular serine protease Vpr